MKTHSTTILSVRRGNTVVVAGDGQVTLGNTVVKGGAKKVRKLGEGRAIGGFAGSAADGMALFERLDDKLREQRSPLRRAAVELAKEWRTDRALRRLEAMIVVADADEARGRRVQPVIDRQRVEADEFRPQREVLGVELRGAFGEIPSLPRRGADRWRPDRPTILTLFRRGAADQANCAGQADRQ